MDKTENEVEGECEPWGDDWFADAWDDEDYEVDPEREWERVTWVEDNVVPLDSYLKLR